MRVCGASERRKRSVVHHRVPLLCSYGAIVGSAELDTVEKELAG
jgi:hypothetical protein